MTNGTWTSINNTSATQGQKNALQEACKISVIHAIKKGWNVRLVVSDSNNGIVGTFTKERYGMTLPAGRIFIGKRGGIHANELTL